MFKKENIFSAVLVCMLFVSFPVTIYAQNSSAEKLASMAPDETLFFVTTSGFEELKPDFEKTILGQIGNDPNMQTFFNSIKDSFLARMSQEMGDAPDQEVFDTVRKYAMMILNRPVIIGAAQKQTSDGPPIYGFAFLDAGQHKAEIASALEELEAMAGEDEIVDIMVGSYQLHAPSDTGDVPGYWGWIDEYLVFAINDGDGLALRNLQSSQTASNYLSNITGANDALAVYFSIEKAFNLFKSIVLAQGDEDEFAMVETLLSDLGFDKIKTLTSGIGFEGTNIVASDFLEIAEPRSGLLAHFKNIDLNMLDMVDSRAMSATLINFNLAGMYDTIYSAVRKIAGEEFDEVEEGIAQIEERLQIKIRQELLESIDGEMLFYVIPATVITELPQGGFAAIIKLKDTDLWNKSISAIEEFAVSQSNGMLQVSSQVQDGKTLKTWGIMPLAMAQVMPTWTIIDDQLILGSNPFMCNLAFSQTESGSESIRDAAGFRNVAANLPDSVFYLRYSDSELQLRQMMTGLQQAWPLVTMMATGQGINLPFVLPDISHIMEKAEPSIEYYWFDQRGLHTHYRGAGIEPSLGAVAGGALGMGILMPALARTRQIAYRMVSGTNLSGIGKAMAIYANDYDDQCPPNLEELIEKCDLPPKVFESKRKPENFDGPTYIYITGQNMSMHPGNIVAYENPEYCSDGVNVLYLDSHVEWVKPDEFMNDLRETYKRLGREMPEIRFAD